MGGGQHFPCIDSPSHFDHFISSSNFRGPPISTVQTTVSTLYCFQEAQRIWMQLVRPSMRHSQHQIILCGHPSLDELRTSHQISHQKHAGPWASNPPVSSPFQRSHGQKQAPTPSYGSHGSFVAELSHNLLVSAKGQGLQDTGKQNTRRKDCCNAAHISAVFILYVVGIKLMVRFFSPPTPQIRRRVSETIGLCYASRGQAAAGGGSSHRVPLTSRSLLITIA